MRAMLWVGGLVVTLAAVVGASRLWAESKEKKSAPRTRIAFFNLTYVVKNYDQYQQFNEEIKKVIEPYQKRDAELRERLEELRRQAEGSSLVPAKGEDRDEKSRKEELEEEGRKIQRRIEDNAAKIKKEASKRSDDEMKIIYAAVVEVARRYATANGIDLVLQYNDAVTQDDLVSPKNIARKLNTGAFMPVYWDESMDISLDLVAMLNQKSRKK